MLHLVVGALFVAAPAGTSPQVGHVVPVKEHVLFTVLGTLQGTPIVTSPPTDMQPINPPGSCPPKCVEPLVLIRSVPLERFGILFRPTKDARLARVVVLIVDKTGQKILAQSASESYNGPLPEQAKGGHLFRLDAEAIKSLSAALKESPDGLRLDASGKGDYKLELVRLE